MVIANTHSQISITLPGIYKGNSVIQIIPDAVISKYSCFKYHIILTNKNGHVTQLKGNSDLLLKWARNVAEIFDKKMIVVMPSGWIEKNNWIPIL